MCWLQAKVSEIKFRIHFSHGGVNTIMSHEQFKLKLEALRDELQARTERTHRHIYQKDEPVSAKFSEQVKERENDELVQALEAEGQQELILIGHALQRLADGTYGQCLGCGEEIPAARLEAVPYTENCIECASKLA